MATIEYLEKRVAGKEKEITKLEKKLERILKAQATDWEVNPYYYGEDDIKWTTRDLEKAKESLTKYRADLETAQQKANSRNVKVIVGFLENWKIKTKEFYIESVAGYNKAYDLWNKQDNEFCDWYYSRKRYEATKEEIAERRAERNMHRESFERRWSWMTPYMERNTLDEAKLDRDLKIEAERKYDFIIERTNAITGTITDASNLHIGMDGELNGYIIGEQGKAKVQTIGAGGWNIQRYHFRTLIHEMRG